MKIKLRRKIGTGMVVMMVAALFLAASIVPSSVGASPWADKKGKKDGMHGKGHHRPALGIWKNQQMVEQLELSEEQVQTLRDADFASREKRLELKSRLDQLRLQVDKAFTLEGGDKQAVRQLAQKAAGLKGQMFVQQVEDRLALETILTSDQVRQLELNKRHGKQGGPGVGMAADAKGDLAARFDGWECRRTR